VGGAGGWGGSGGDGGDGDGTDAGDGGMAGNAGAAGAAEGGGLFNAGGWVAISNSRFADAARSGSGGYGGEGGFGGSASGGTGNSGNGGAAGTASAGGDALGGGIFNAAGSLTISNTQFAGNLSEGGQGGQGGNGGWGGNVGNLSGAGNGGNGQAGTDGGASGRGEGGALYIAAGTVTVRGSTFSSNEAGNPFILSGLGGEGGFGGAALEGNPGSGGAAGNGGSGGLGAGGAIFCAGGTVTVDSTTLSANQANGIAGGDGSAAVGGGFSESSPPIMPPVGNGGAGGDARGGAIEIAGGAFTLTNSTLFDNVATAGGGGISADGAHGGINSLGTVAGNGGQGGAGGAGGNSYGGAIDLSGGTLQVVSTTFAASSSGPGNEASGGAGSNGGAGGTGGGGSANISTGGNGGNGGAGGAGGSGLGGAINVAAGTLTLSSCTIAQGQATAGASGAGGAGGAGGSGTSTNGNPGNPGANGAAGSGLGGGVHVTSGATAKLFNSLLAGDTATGDPVHKISSSDVAGHFNSQGHNLVGDGSDGTGFSTARGDQVGTKANPINPLLGTLGDNGGPTWTMALLAGSPAINAPNLPHSPAVSKLDQRGVLRDSAPDIGAFEVSTVNGVPVLTAPGVQSAWSGSNSSLNLGSFTDATTGSPWTVTVNWGDGSKTTFSATVAGTLPKKSHNYKTLGSYTVTETVTNAQGAVATQTFLVQVGALVVTPSATSMTAGTSIGLTVTVLDAANHLDAGYTGKFNLTSTDTQATFRDAVTGTLLSGNAYSFVVGDHGTHSFTVELVKSGAQKITVKGATGGAPTNSSTVTVTPAAPAVVAVLAGAGQTTKVDTTFAGLLEALVTDAFGNAVSGVTVTFTAPASGPSGTFAGGGTTVTVVTDAKGVAVAPAFTADDLTGPYTVTADVSGLGSEADFGLTND
jgi:hypothetical protein